MSVFVQQDDMFVAYEWVSACTATGADCEVHVSRTTGLIFWSGEGVEDELPDDVEDDSEYVAFPGESEFDRGRSLALRFPDEQMPGYATLSKNFFARKARSSASSPFSTATVDSTPGIDTKKRPPKDSCARGVPKMALCS